MFVDILKGGRGILAYYNGSHIRALTHLYSEFVLQKEKFRCGRPSGKKEFEKSRLQNIATLF